MNVDAISIKGSGICTWSSKDERCLQEVFCSPSSQVLGLSDRYSLLEIKVDCLNSRMLSVEIFLLALFPAAGRNKFILKKGEARTSYQALQLVPPWPGELHLCCFLSQTSLFCMFSISLTHLLNLKRNTFLFEVSLLERNLDL